MEQEVVKEVLEGASNISLWGLFLQADIVVKLVMLILLLASIWCWTIIIEKLFLSRKELKLADKFENEFWSGASLDDTFKLASEANNNVRTLGVALSPCILPEAGKPTFEIKDDEIEIGMGIHGEPGIKREKLRDANDLVDDLYKRIIDDSKLKANDIVAVMINSLGATPLEELYIISKKVNENLSKSNIQNSKTYVGRYATSMEMAGMSITTLKLNNNLKKYLFAESTCPFWNN